MRAVESESLGLGGVVRGGLWLYIAGLLSSFLGYLYWLLASRLVDPSVVGSAAAVVAFSTLITGLLTFGVPTGLMRFVGVGLGRGDSNMIFSYSATAILFTVTLDLAAAATLTISHLLGSNILSGFELTAAVVLTSLGWSSALTATFNSLLRTELTALASFTSAALRITIGLALLYLGLGFVGIILGYIVSSITLNITLLIFWFKVKREAKTRLSLTNLVDMLKAGLATWLPGSLTLLAQQLGVLGLYTIVGGVETGLYYIAFAVASVIYSLPSSMLSLMLPALSAMKGGRAQATARATRLSLALAAPPALILAAYPHLPLQLLGQSYLAADTTLMILIVGVLAAPIASGYSSYIYAEGRYTRVLLIGLAGNITRISLYTMLIGLGEVGVATAYSAGFIAALLATIPSSAKMGLKQDWLGYTKAIIIPASATIAIYTLNIHWLAGIPLVAVASAFAYARLKVVDKRDLSEVAEALLSKERLTKIYVYAKPLIKLIYGE